MIEPRRKAQATSQELQEDTAGDSPEGNLLAAAGAGDKQAFAQLMQMHARMVMAVAQRILGNQADADDVAQEAFLRLWAHAAKWNRQGPAQLRTWLTRVVTNLCLDRLRKRRWVALDELNDIPSPHAGPDKDAHVHSNRVLINRLLGHLPDSQRTAVTLAYFEEMSTAEVAESMRQSLGAVESLLVRARRTLREKIKSHAINLEEDI